MNRIAPLITFRLPAVSLTGKLICNPLTIKIPDGLTSLTPRWGVWPLNADYYNG